MVIYRFGHFDTERVGDNQTMWASLVSVFTGVACECVSVVREVCFLPTLDRPLRLSGGFGHQIIGQMIIGQMVIDQVIVGHMIVVR